MFKWLPKSKKNQFHVTTREYRVVLVAVVGICFLGWIGAFFYGPQIKYTGGST